MIEYIEDKNIFESGADALVNPVNCVGYMGKGLALEFKKRFPEYFPPYKAACEARKLRPGKPFYLRMIMQPDLLGVKQAVIMFPTKDHWKEKSRIEWIDDGLAYLQSNYRLWRLGSIAMPQVGCGLGGLAWEEVKPLIHKYFQDEPVKVEVYIRDENKPRDEANVNEAGAKIHGVQSTQ